jgi:hypothetical protein
MSLSLSMVVAVAEHAEEVKPLQGRSILIVLAIIAAIVFAIVLAGFGYFSPGDGDGAGKSE